MSTIIKHSKLNEDEIGQELEVKSKISNSDVENIQGEPELHLKIESVPENNQVQGLIAASINNIEPNILDYNLKSKMDNDMNQKIILDDSETGNKSYGKEDIKRNSDMVNLQKNEESGNETSFQRKIAGGLIGSVKANFTNTLENCLYNIPKYGKAYFEVDTNLIKSRLIQGVLPHKNQLYETTKDSPDLYGPFWIYTSVVFCLAASGSVYQFIHGSGKAAPTTFAEFVSTTSFWIYMIGFLFPLVIYALLKYTGSNISYMQALCIYGYTFSIFIPVSVMCVFFGSFIDWIVLLYAGVSSSYLLISAYSKFFTDKIDKNKKYIFLGLVAVVQLFLILFLRYYFFNAPAVVATVSTANNKSGTINSKASNSNNNKLLVNTSSSKSMVINPDDHSSLDKNIKQAEEASSKKSQEEKSTSIQDKSNEVITSSKKDEKMSSATNELDNSAKEYENKKDSSVGVNHTV